MNRLITDEIFVDPDSMHEEDLQLLQLDLDGGRLAPEGYGDALGDGGSD